MLTPSNVLKWTKMTQAESMLLKEREMSPRWKENEREKTGRIKGKMRSCWMEWFFHTKVSKGKWAFMLILMKNQDFYPVSSCYKIKDGWKEDLLWKTRRYRKIEESTSDKMR